MIQPSAPTVTEFAEGRIRQIGHEIAELEAERQMLKHRLKRYAGSTMHEAERAATAAEPFQATQLPQGGAT